ncbi:MAG: winged helix-turn-helix domain-containing protein, partial [Paracoccaceae bacterium]|nr:winged helix-turn-helix domain-containing protein [Paracoccaceae bacterium]
MDYVFGNFILDLNRGELRDAEGTISIEPRALDLLTYLVENDGRLVSRDELVNSVWDGRIVSDAAISTAVKAARRALADDGTEQVWLKTVRGRGFRFEGKVSLRAAPTAKSTAQADDPLVASETVRKPRIAVLPFSSVGFEGPQQALGDGVPAEIIMSLSRLRWIEVIARGSSFRFRGDTVEMNALKGLLNAGYCLAGSVEPSGSDVVVMTELSDTSSGAVIWAERFVGKRDQVQDIRLQIVSSVVAALDVHISQHEAEKARLRDPENLDAWGNYHLGLTHVNRFNAHDNRLAEGYFERAIALDPAFSSAHSAMSFAKFQTVFLRYSPDREAAVAEAMRFAERAIEIDPTDPQSHFAMGRISWLQGRPNEGRPWLDMALAHDPNFARAFYTRGAVNMMDGHAKDTLADMGVAKALSPLDPLLPALLAVRGLAELQLGLHDEAVKSSEQAALAPRAH